MAMITKTSPKIFTGTSKTIQRVPPQEIPQVTRRQAPQREIGFISQTKKLAEAKKETKPVEEATLKDINTVVQQVKDSGLTGAEAGYAINQLIGTTYGESYKAAISAVRRKSLSPFPKREAWEAAVKEWTSGVLSGLKPELRSWYDKQVSEYQKVISECNAKYKAELEKVKEKYGKDPRKYTNEKLKLKAEIYPSWSSEAKAAVAKFEERQDKLADAISAAKKAGVKGLSSEEIYTLATTTPASAKKQAAKKGLSTKQLSAIRGEKIKEDLVEPEVTITPVIEQRVVQTIEATPEELKKAEKAKAEAESKGWSCYAQINTYKVTTSGGDVVLVEAFDKKTAESKAEDAGHKVAWVTKQMSWETVEPRKVETGAYEVNFKDGTKIVMEPIKDPKTGEPTWGIPALEKYKNAEGNYDLIRILEEKPVSQSALKHIFGEEMLKSSIAASEALNKLKPYKTKEGYNLVDAFAKGDITRDEAKAIFDAEVVDSAVAYAKLASAPSLAGATVDSPVAGKRTATLSEMEAFKKATPLMDYALVAADALVPFCYVIRHWDDISVAERALWIGLDVASFIAPLAGAAVRGARGAVAAGKAARLIGAAKGVGRELVVMVKGPVTTIMHPVATMKQALVDTRSILTNVFHPKKIPEAVLTTTEGTLRIKLTGATSVDDFMAARDKLMKLAAQGQKPIVELKDTSGKVIATLELTKAPLMREVKGGIVHTTPWGTQFQDALTVRMKPAMGAAEQGLFVSHEPLPRFARQSAFNLPVEIKPTTAAKQVITTKIGYNQVVSISLEKKLTDEVLESLTKAKLIETAGQDLAPLSARQVKRLADVLRSSGNIKAASAFQQTVDAYKPVFRIISPDKVDDLVGTGKVYRGTVEMEAKLPVGAKVQPPKQVLFTHIGPEGTKVELWLDKPLSAKQILQLKAEGLAEVFKQPFRTPLKVTSVKGAGLTQQQVSDLANIIKAAGNTDVAQNLQRAYQLSRSQSRLAQIVARAGMGAVTRVPGRAAVREPERDIEYIALSRGVEALRRGERPGAARELARGATAERAERLERAEREERGGRAERAARERRHERPERIERLEREERFERPVRPLKITRAQRRQRPTEPTRTKDEFVPTKLGRERVPGPGQALQVWDQGAFWISVFEPFRTMGTKPDVVYSRHKPPWAGRIAKGRGSPQKTFRAIGKRHPKLVRLPMGVVTARVKNGRVLKFSSD